MTQLREKMEARRIKAEAMLRDGNRVSEIAHELNVNRLSVYRWKARMQTPGGMKAVPGSGRRPRVPFDRLRALWLTRPAWTADEFTIALSELGATYHRDHVYRIMERLKTDAARTDPR